MKNPRREKCFVNKNDHLNEKIGKNCTIGGWIIHIHDSIMVILFQYSQLRVLLGFVRTLQSL